MANSHKRIPQLCLRHVAMQYPPMAYRQYQPGHQLQMQGNPMGFYQQQQPPSNIMLNPERCFNTSNKSSPEGNFSTTDLVALKI